MHALLDVVREIRNTRGEYKVGAGESARRRARIR